MALAEIARTVAVVSGSDTQPGQSGVILRLQAAVLSHRTYAAAATALASNLADLLMCKRVSVGMSERGYAKVVAVSHGTQIEAAREVFVRIGAAMDEAIEQGASIVAPATAGVAQHIARANSAMLGHGTNAVCSVPLVNFGQVIGALTLERSGESFSATEILQCEDIACMIGPVLELKREAELSAARRALLALRRLASNLADPGSRRIKLASIAVAIAFVATLFIPMPYRLGAPARIEGSKQRVMVAPADGFLQNVKARPGDRVREGQILIELSTQDLRVDLSKRQSEYAQHENAYLAALGRSDRTQLVINQARAAEAKAQLALVENQIARANIRAPFDGVVILGDLTQSVGAPVQRGEVLLTLAPNDQFRLIVEVDERDIAMIRSGQVGALALAALPQDRFKFVVGRILPVASAAEGRNFFEVEALLDPAERALRPGLRGVAKIEVGNHSLFWAWTHRLFDWLRIGWWALGA